MQDQQLGAQKEMQLMMEELANAPQYQAQQAALPQVQAPAQPFKSAPQAPNLPYIQSPQAPPAPETFPSNTNNGLGFVTQQKSVRSRSRQASRGTSRLRN